MAVDDCVGHRAGGSAHPTEYAVRHASKQSNKAPELMVHRTVGGLCVSSDNDCSDAARTRFGIQPISDGPKRGSDLLPFNLLILILKTSTWPAHNTPQSTVIQGTSPESDARVILCKCIADKTFPTEYTFEMC